MLPGRVCLVLLAWLTHSTRGKMVFMMFGRIFEHGKTILKSKLLKK